MDLFDVLNLIGGLSLFLFGMTIMGQALERRAGNKLKALLGRMTTNRFAGLLTGLGVTAIIQSSSATTVMLVGFVNSGLMSLKQSINVIMGANIGTTVTAWILSLAGIESNNVFVKLLKPSSFTPILALLGIVFFMASKNSKRKDTVLNKIEEKLPASIFAGEWEYGKTIDYSSYSKRESNIPETFSFLFGILAIGMLFVLFLTYRGVIPEYLFH